MNTAGAIVDGRVAFTALAVVALTAAVFAPAIGFEYLGVDDPRYVTENPHVQQGLTFQNAAWAATTTEGEYWHPVTWLSYLIDSSAFGTGAETMHRTNVLIHSLNSGLLCVLLAALGASPAVAGSTAVLFALHPMRVESVAWIAERKGLLAAFFLLLALLTYVNEVRSKRRPILSALWFFLGCASKPTAMVLPALLLATDYWPLRRTARLRSLLVEKMPFWLIGAADLISTYLFEHKNIEILAPVPAWTSLRLAIVAMGLYFQRTFFPSWREAWFSFIDPSTQVPNWTFLISLAGLGALTVAAIAWRKRAPWFVAGLAWFVIALAPTIGLVRFTVVLFGDRYSYIAHLGPAIAAPGFVAWLTSRSPRLSRALPFGAMIAGVWFVLCTRHNLPAWRDLTTFAQQTIELEPDNAWAHNIVGIELCQARRLDEALSELDKAIALHADYWQAWNNRGVTLELMGRRDEARKNLEKALSLASDARIGRNIVAVDLKRRGPARVELKLVDGLPWTRRSAR